MKVSVDADVSKVADIYSLAFVSVVAAADTTDWLVA